MTVILIFIMAGLLIRNAAVTTVNNTKQQVGASVTLSANRDQAFKKMRSSTPPTSTSEAKPSLSMPSVSLANVKKIAALSGVANYNVSVATSANAYSIDAISTSSASNNGPMGMSQSTSSGDFKDNTK